MLVTVLFVALAVAGGIAAYIWNLIRIRKRDTQPGMPQPPMTSLVWGHLIFMGELANQFPKGAHSDYFFRKLLADLKNPPFLRVDIRPVKWPVLLIADGDFQDQVVRAKALPYGAVKSPDYLRYSNTLGGESMIMKNGEEWRVDRKRYNPGFQPQHLVTLIPEIGQRIVECGQIFQKYADGGLPVDIMEYFTRLTFEVIGIVTAETNLDILDLDNKRGSFGAEVYTSFMNLLKTYEGEDDAPFEIDPILKLRRWWLSRKWDQHTKQIITSKLNSKLNPRSILGLSFNADPKPSIQTMADNLKAFMFAGHDTTAITASWAFYFIATEPHVRSKFVEEIDETFKLPDHLTPAQKTERTLALIIEAPNKTIYGMPYTNAIVKEVLRHHPPAGTSRFLPASETDKIKFKYKGHTLDVHNNILYCPSSLPHRNKDFWGEDADEFKPERWLTDFGKEAEQSNWYRPFEKGPRSCIGMGLATMEVLMALVMLGWRWDLEMVEKGPPLVTRKVTAKPIDGIKMWLRERK